MNYQQLDRIADSYVPILVFITFAWYVKRAIAEDSKDVAIDFSATILGVVIIYLFMYIDSSLNAYSSIGLDYSTHTALALVFVTALSLIGRRALYTAAFSMVVYCALMLYQEYHTLLDFVLTTLNTLPIIIWLHVRARKITNRN